MSPRRSVGTVALCTGFVVLLGVVGCTATAAQGTSEHRVRPHQLPYVAGELIVKLAPEAGAALTTALENGQLPTQTGLAWFDELNARYEVSAIQPVFAQQPDIEAIKRKYPERSRRAPPDAKIPSLKYVYKLTLRHGANVLQAAQNYAAHSEVEYAEPNYLATVQTGTPTLP